MGTKLICEECGYEFIACNHLGRTTIKILAERDRWKYKAEVLTSYLQSAIPAEYGEGDSSAAAIGREIQIQRDRILRSKAWEEGHAGCDCAGVCVNPYKKDGEK